MYMSQHEAEYHKQMIQEQIAPLLKRIEKLEAELKKPHSSPQQRIVYARGISDVDAPSTADAEKEWKRLNSVFHQALARYTDSHHALHYLWNNTIAGPARTTDDASQPPSETVREQVAIRSAQIDERWRQAIRDLRELDIAGDVDSVKRRIFDLIMMGPALPSQNQETGK